MSWMGRAMYTYDNRYMLMATVRADASSRLAKAINGIHTRLYLQVGILVKNHLWMTLNGWTSLKYV